MVLRTEDNKKKKKMRTRGQRKYKHVITEYVIFVMLVL